MSWTEALEVAIGRTGHARLRDLCAESWPAHAAYRALVVRLATGAPPDPEPDARLRAHLARHGCGGCN